MENLILPDIIDRQLHHLQSTDSIPVELLTYSSAAPIVTYVNHDNIKSDETMQKLQRVSFLREKELSERSKLYIEGQQRDVELNAQKIQEQVANKVFLMDIFPREYEAVQRPAEMTGSGCNCECPEISEDECTCKMCGGGIFGDVLNWLKK